jgi:hypothetical protein
MKNYLKISIVALLFALLTVSALAQPHQAKSFLNVQAIYLTNLLNFTNLSTAMVAGNGGTNAAGTVYSNANVRVIVNDTSASSNTTAAAQNVFKDVALWALQGGGGAWGETNTLSLRESFATLSVTLTAGSAANTALTFVFTPIYDGVNEATATTEEWTASLTPVVSKKNTLVSNVPLWRWPGAKYLRLRWAANTDADASGNVIVTGITLNGFVP